MTDEYETRRVRTHDESPFVHERPTVSEQSITFYLAPSDDPEISCLVCNRPRCDLETETLPPNGNRAVAGFHSRCLDRYRKL